MNTLLKSATEDDTFNALRRIPYRDLKIKIGRALAEQTAYGTLVDLDSLCRENGWTFMEYELTRQEAIKCYKAHIFDPGESYKIVHASPYPEPTYWK